MPTNHGLVGYDYNYYLPYLLAGEQWINMNGWLTPAYFTPAFCGGMPWLANPESMVWSLPQLLFNTLGPLPALRWTFAIMADAGALGTWLLLHRSLRASKDAATLGAALFLLNGFLTYRMAIGHLTYHVLGLIPLLALLVLQNRNLREMPLIQIVSRCFGAATILAVMVFSGAPNFVVPSILSVVAVIVMYQLKNGLRLTPWLLLTGACIWSIPLAAIKLVPALIFILQYPRSYLNSGLFSDPFEMFAVIIRAFFLPGSLPDTISLGPGRIFLGKHEFEYGLTVVPFVLMIVVAVSTRWRWPRRPALCACLFAVLVFPFAVSVGGPTWEHVLASIPIINNDTVMTRWWAIDILPAILAAGICFDSISRRIPWPRTLLVVAAAVAVLQSGYRPTSYYTTGRVFPLYRPRGIIQAHAALKAGRSLPPIDTIGPATAGPSGDIRAPMDGLLRGDSSLPCYESVFGYRSEWMPANQLVFGPIDQATSGSLNISDPRCYLDPGTNCHPGSAIPATEAAAAAAWTHYHPIPWRIPWWQAAANVMTCAALGFSLLIVLLAASTALFAPGRSRAH